ncbi:lamin tail domain-containing protein [Undibacterium sp. Jales W-56]|uniref:lamin tail domain-containing protein n=1 Tax=Undibacterium sp. Jales W-56 TaxID=2897325 RepID=UPI0021D21B71|nr:lamin tail domain-containing protein [Undibacterium sp. Jales W-56]MCU6432601.1 lamin tail domain-containing protein [Undibacterium sp. Jales W-56]
MKKIFLAIILAFSALLPLMANASFIVYVGYADSLRPSPFFPNPYGGADIFQGNLGSLDTGAVRIQNTGATNLSLQGLTVTLNAGAYVYNLWTFGSGLTLLPGQNAVFASTANYNFDTSDLGVLGAFAPNNDNCSVGPTSLTPLCILNAPVVKFTVDGVMTSLVDTGHVLDTGGYDFVNSNPCPVPGDRPGACNESLQWRLIGTTGIQNPGGNVPEPATLALLGLGLVFLAWKRKYLA